MVVGSKNELIMTMIFGGTAMIFYVLIPVFYYFLSYKEVRSKQKSALSLGLESLGVQFATSAMFTVFITILSNIIGERSGGFTILQFTASIFRFDWMSIESVAIFGDKTTEAEAGLAFILKIMAMVLNYSLAIGVIGFFFWIGFMAIQTNKEQDTGAVETFLTMVSHQGILIFIFIIQFALFSNFIGGILKDANVPASAFPNVREMPAELNQRIARTLGDV